MREAQINRMNFLKHGGAGITYKTLMYGLIAWTAFLILLYGIQFLRYFFVVSEVKSVKAEISRLDQEKDRQIELVRLMSKKRIGISAQENLTSIIVNRPRWSRLLKGLVKALPSDVWLDTVRVTGSMGDAWYKIHIKGQAKSQRSLTNFIMKMEASGLFRKTALDKTALADDSGGVVNYKLSTEPVMKQLVGDNA